MSFFCFHTAAHKQTNKQAALKTQPLGGGKYYLWEVLFQCGDGLGVETTLILWCMLY